jgi:hypothetical protein
MEASSVQNSLIEVYLDVVSILRVPSLAREWRSKFSPITTFAFQGWKTTRVEHPMTPRTLGL